jgi:DNA-dependent protein kinase catalytic subunit
MALLDAILDGLVDPENGSLREFCADCFAEFMRWSVRHAPPEADNFANVTSMLRRVYNRMDHPNPYHRLGAAMAAHRIYPVLRENGAIVDRHIFEILFFCIKSLRLAETDDEQTGLSCHLPVRVPPHRIHYILYLILELCSWG